jgi:hypothetical protein
MARYVVPQIRQTDSQAAYARRGGDSDRATNAF